MWPLIIPAITQLLDKLIPDPQAKAAAQLEWARLQQTGELAQLEAWKAVNLAQIGNNNTEAQQGAFRGGWRPYIGWTCGMGLSYQFILRPLLPWCLKVAGIDAPPLPPLEMGELMSLVLGMLGLGGLRTYERVNGKA